MHGTGRGFLIRLGLAAVSALLLVITHAWRDWIEIAFRVDPDRGSGWLEWLFVLVTFSLSLIFSVSARREWRRFTSITAVGGGTQ